MDPSITWVQAYHTFALVSYGSAKEVITLQPPLGFSVLTTFLKDH